MTKFNISLSLLTISGNKNKGRQTNEKHILYNMYISHIYTPIIF